jgi:tetratricopeptide (TPR) repeat protein
VSQHATPKESGSQHTPASQTIVNANATDATSSQPALRVYLLGPLTIEQANGTLLNLDMLLGRSQSSILFKLLLCHPERRVIRERLVDTLWPGQSYNTMEGSLGVAKSVLKTRLETICGQPVMPRVSGDPPSYSLVGQSVIWTDIDACEQCIRQAINTKSAQDALMLWETAYALMQRGTLLADDQTAYWYQTGLVQDHRKRLARQRTQCVLRIADLALECEDSGRAVTVLGEESEAAPTNEEIALHLMELLARNGRHAEALRCYARLEAALLEHDAEPWKATKALAQQLRSMATTKISLERHALFIPLQAESQIEGERETRAVSPGSELQIPQQAPSLWTVPYPRNPFFTGRQELLTSIHNQLHQTPAVAVTQAQAICGLGGIGKTQVALEYAYRYRQEYQAIFWVKADTRENLLADFLATARLLQLPEQSAGDRAVTATAVRHWFQFHERWLLILDNADDLVLVRGFLPSGHQGHVLLTTRMQAVGGLAYGVQIEEMDQEVGALFLLRRAGLLPPDASILDKTTADALLAQEFVQEVGGLPLALDQAGAYIEETASSLQEYLDFYHTYRLALLQRRGGLTMDHPESVATTWALAFTHLENNDPVAADLLRLCAFLDPDAIPEEILFAGLQQLAVSSSEIHQLRFNEAIGSLLHFSLVRRNADAHTITVHRLIQSVIRDNLLPEQQAEWIHCVVHLLSEAFPPAVEVTSWPLCEKLLPHALLCAHWIEQAHITSMKAASLLNAIGYYLNMRARYDIAKPLFERTLRIREQVLGEQHPDTAQTLSDLAYLYHHQDQFEEAMHFLQRSFSIRQQVLGMEHPDTATSLNALALLYRDQGRYEEAEPFFQQALAIRKQIFGIEHPQTAHSLSNLAWLYRNLGKYHEAELLYEQSLTIRKRILGVDHPDTATSLNGLALLYAAQKKYAKAEPLFQQAVTIRQEVLGTKHLHTTQSMNALALLYRDQGEYEKAELLFLEVLAIREQLFGREHSRTLAVLNNLRRCQEEMKK